MLAPATHMTGQSNPEMYFRDDCPHRAAEPLLEEFRTKFDDFKE